MSQITHWNPFKATRGESGGSLDQFFRDLGLRPLLGQFELPDIRIDVNESDKAYTVKADIPGVKKEDIDVSIDGRQVAISAKSSRRSEKQEENSLYSERSEGQVYRSFTLPVEVDSKDAQAKYDNGVLSLSLPKKGNGNNHRVKVS